MSQKIIPFEKLKEAAKEKGLQPIFRHEVTSPFSSGFSVSALIEALPSVLNDLGASSAKNRELCVEQAQEMEREAHRIIDQWDVREVRKLIAAFPMIVPKKYRNASIRCEMQDNDEGDYDWVVVFEKG
ncbi:MULTISPECIES: hypothetical protein [unclassified Thioalkalivibrio]|uniref:hypothetical protein n=1 Tax=unclassified Thioalkalivibrio TaxID=2621013 RepID=UPI000371F3B4|nr:MULTISPECIES: hypothetical protein [unclassified Thioalkalivibrio]